MKKYEIDNGTTDYTWVTYKEIMSGNKKNIQVVRWPNGEGVTIMRPNETSIDIGLDEWLALGRAMKEINSVK